eukprot:6244379-Alexandrium_andersonii.AAC.1
MAPWRTICSSTARPIVRPVEQKAGEPGRHPVPAREGAQSPMGSGASWSSGRRARESARTRRPDAASP